MTITEKSRDEMRMRFEAALDYITQLDRVGFHIKREAAEAAAAAAILQLEGIKGGKQ